MVCVLQFWLIVPLSEAECVAARDVDITCNAVAGDVDDDEAIFGLQQVFSKQTQMMPLVMLFR